MPSSPSSRRRCARSSRARPSGAPGTRPPRRRPPRRVRRRVEAHLTALHAGYLLRDALRREDVEALWRIWCTCTETMYLRAAVDLGDAEEAQFDPADHHKHRGRGLPARLGHALLWRLATMFGVPVSDHDATYARFLKEKAIIPIIQTRITIDTGLPIIKFSG